MLYQYLSRIGCSKSHLHNQMVKFEYISDDMSWNGGYYFVLLLVLIPTKKIECVIFFMIRFFLEYFIFQN